MPFRPGNTVGVRFKPGNVPVNALQPGSAHPNYRGDKVQCRAAHRRVVALNGPARQWLCATCGKQAIDWAYTKNDPNERTGPHDGRIAAWSTDPGYYIPLCRKCHVRYDR